MTIYYNTENAPYNCFSNFSPHGIELDGQWWSTVEHYFQAQKFAGTHHVDVIRCAQTPLEAAQLGQERTRPLRHGWRQIKEEIMLKGVPRKFQTHADIRAVLLGTGNQWIVEDWPHDYYWSNGADMSGKNRMGHTLMVVREILRKAEYAKRTFAHIKQAPTHYAIPVVNSMQPYQAEAAQPEAPWRHYS